MLFGNLDVICSTELANIRVASCLHTEALGSAPIRKKRSTGSLVPSAKGVFASALECLCLCIGSCLRERYHECCALGDVREIVLVFACCAPHVLWGHAIGGKQGDMIVQTGPFE